MDADRKTRAVVITEIISPYRIPVFNEIARNPEIDFTVLFLAETEPNRLWRVEKEKIRFPYEVLPGIRIPLPDRFSVFLNPGIISRLGEKDPDVVICGGYQHPSCLLALSYAKKHKKRFLLWCESHAESIRLAFFPFNLYRNHFIHACDGFIVPGRKSLNFIQGFGVNGKQSWIAPNAVDNRFFSEGAKSIRLKLEENRRKMGFPPKLILYVGRLVDTKGIPALLEAFLRLPKSLEAGLILVGDGADRKKYENFCNRHRLSNVFFEGFKQQEELPAYYGLAGLFVLPSYREEWGLVLNEAAASRLPLIATDATGAAFDLIQEGKNGFCVSKGNVEALQTAMTEILTNLHLRERMARNSLERVKAFSPQKCAEGFREAILSGR